MTTEQLNKLPKWAQVEWTQKEKQLRLSRAFGWPISPDPKPADTKAMIGNERGKLFVGWSSHTNGENFRVALGCCSTIYHNPDGIDRTTTQGAGRFYLTKLDALIHCRWELCNRFAESLAKLDAQIETSEEAPPAYITDSKNL